MLSRLALFLFAGLVWAQQNVVSLSAPLTETIYLLGEQDRLAAVSDVCVFPEQLVQDRKSGKVRVVGSFSRPDLAAIDRIHPALILTGTAFQRGLAEQFRAKGYKVLHFEPSGMEDIFVQIHSIGEVLGKSHEASRIAQGMRRELAEISAISARLPLVRVYMEINHEGPWTSGRRSAVSELIRAAGGENIFADHEGGVFVTSNEEIVKRNPDVILSPIWLDAKVGGIDGITTLHEIMTRPGYADITAVRNGRVLYYDSALMKQDGPREIQAVRKLAYLLHPEAFENPAGTIPWELGRIRP
jgi:iron complex transport system substrate-binding protein